MSQVLQWTQFWKLMTKRGLAPSASRTTTIASGAPRLGNPAAPTAGGDPLGVSPGMCHG
jgi:hypothetical protein